MEKFKAVCINPTKGLTKDKIYLVEHSQKENFWNYKLSETYRVKNDRGYVVNVLRSRFSVI